MSLSDCSKCWETPCVCGNEYLNYSLKQLTEMRDLFDRLIREKNEDLERRNNPFQRTFDVHGRKVNVPILGYFVAPDGTQCDLNMRLSAGRHNHYCHLTTENYVEIYTYSIHSRGEQILDRKIALYSDLIVVVDEYNSAKVAKAKLIMPGSMGAFVPNDNC